MIWNYANKMTNQCAQAGVPRLLVLRLVTDSFLLWWRKSRLLNVGTPEAPASVEALHFTLSKYAVSPHHNLIKTSKGCIDGKKLFY